MSLGVGLLFEVIAWKLGMKKEKKPALREPGRGSCACKDRPRGLLGADGSPV